MFLDGHGSGWANVGLSRESLTVLGGKADSKDYEPAELEEVTAFRVLGATTIWLDIVHSVTAGTKPSSWPNQIFAANSTCQIHLQKIMGCENWAMIEIGRIAALHEEKMKSFGSEDRTCVRFNEEVNSIRFNIKQGLTQLMLETSVATEKASQQFPKQRLLLPAMITRIFALSARIYLQLVLGGFQVLQETEVSAAMEALRAESVFPFRAALVFPLFICGIVSTPCNKKFIRDVFSSEPIRTPSLQHREKVILVIEEIWSMKERDPGYTWKDCLALTGDVLLH